MSKSGFASEKVMRHYLNALLVDEQEQTITQADDEALQPVAKLLEKVNVLEHSVSDKSSATKKASIPTELNKQITTTPSVAVTPKIEHATSIPRVAKEAVKEYRSGSFQALFFNVAGLTVAVPLTELGGIHNLGKLNTLPGKPEWFKGVMVHREDKLNVVDTALWVMPEKYDEQMAASIDYQYVIMLDNSNWGLACETLVNTITLSQDDVKWREHKGRRPWLAGLIKERMCALLDVSALIELLELGQNSVDDHI